MITITRESKLFPVILALFAALPPLAVNIYAPAIHLIALDFNVTNGDVLSTFATYFVGFSFGMLFWGAISDKYGRKNVMIVGSVVYIVSTIACTYSTDFHMLEMMRLLQGLADSVGGVIAFSIARDCYKGAKLTSMIATIVIIMLVAPIIAPIIGTIMTAMTGTWQSTFHFLTFYGVVILIASLVLEETLDVKDRQTKLLKLIPSYYHHLKNLKFMLATFASGMVFAALLIYISSSAIIYLSNYDVSSFMYCVYYGSCVVASIIANMVIKRYSHKLQEISSIYSSVVVLLLSCISLVIINFLNMDNAFIYTVVMFVMCAAVSFICTILYSYAINQVDDNFGTANSISNFIKNMIAAGGTMLVSYYHGRDLILASPIVQSGFVIIAIVMLYVIFVISRNDKTVS